MAPHPMLLQISNPPGPSGRRMPPVRNPERVGLYHARNRMHTFDFPIVVGYGRTLDGRRRRRVDGLRLGVNLWSQASDWPAFLRAGQRAEELGFDHLWTWDHLLAIFGEPDQPIFEGLCGARRASPRRRRGSASGSSSGPTRSDARARGEGHHHHRPHQRRPRGPGHRRGVVRGGAPRLRPRLRLGLRAAPGLAGRGRRRDARAPRRRGGHQPAGRALRVRPPADRPAAASSRTCRS